MAGRAQGSGRKTAKYAPFRDPPGVDGALARLALAQHCVFHVDQIAAIGLSKRGTRDRAKKGALHRIHHGVYSLVPEPLLSRSGRYMAAVLACGPGAALSHHAAGHHHGLLVSNRARIDVTVPTRSGRIHRPGIRIHRSATLRPTDIQIVDGIPTTTVARTIFDLADIQSQRQLERLLDQAAINDVFDLIALDDQLTNNAGRRRVVAKLARALTEHRAGSTPTDNDFGEAMLALTRKLGLPDPEVQQWLDLGDGLPMIRPDFMWRDWRLIVETDSQKWHSSRQRFESDRERDQRSVAAGWTPLRITWRQLTRASGPLGERLLSAVARAKSASEAPAKSASEAGAKSASEARPTTRSEAA